MSAIVFVREIKNATSEQTSKLLRSAQLVQNVVNSPKFQERVLGFSFKEQGLTIRAFRMNKGMTNKQVLAKLLTGSELSDPAADGEIDLHLRIYESQDNVLGYTYAATRWQHINNKYFRTNRLADVASNILHEYLHRQGWGHEQKYSAERQYTVPYALGYICRDVALTMKEGKVRT